MILLMFPFLEALLGRVPLTQPYRIGYIPRAEMKPPTRIYEPKQNGWNTTQRTNTRDEKQKKNGGPYPVPGSGQEVFKNYRWIGSGRARGFRKTTDRGS